MFKLNNVKYTNERRKYSPLQVLLRNTLNSSPIKGSKFAMYYSQTAFLAVGLLPTAILGYQRPSKQVYIVNGNNISLLRYSTKLSFTYVSALISHLQPFGSISGKNERIRPPL